MGNDIHVGVSHKHCGSQGRMGGHIVVMKELVVVVPQSIAHFLSNTSKRCSKSAS
jgi:hypothetical protein